MAPRKLFQRPLAQPRLRRRAVGMPPQLVRLPSRPLQRSLGTRTLPLACARRRSSSAASTPTTCKGRWSGCCIRRATSIPSARVLAKFALKCSHAAPLSPQALCNDMLLSVGGWRVPLCQCGTSWLEFGIQVWQSVDSQGKASLHFWPYFSLGAAFFAGISSPLAHCMCLLIRTF